MAHATLHIEVVSPEGVIFSGEADELIIPTVNGEIAVLPNHAAIFTKLSDGEAIIKHGGKITTYAITGGFLEVQKNTVSVLSDYAIKAENIEIAKIEAAKKRAEDILNGKIATADFTLAQKELERSILTLKVAEKIRKRPRQ